MALAQTQGGRISVIGQNLEKYLLVEWGEHLQFKDSLQFMPSSLDTLVENLKKTGNDGSFGILREAFPDATPEQWELLKQKGVYPYDWMNPIVNVEEAALPPIEDFHSILRDSDVTAEEYERAQTVWRLFNCQKFKDYHELYLKSM